MPSRLSFVAEDSPIRTPSYGYEDYYSNTLSTRRTPIALNNVLSILSGPYMEFASSSDTAEFCCFDASENSGLVQLYYPSQHAAIPGTCLTLESISSLVLTSLYHVLSEMPAWQNTCQSTVSCSYSIQRAPFIAREG